MPSSPPQLQFLRLPGYQTQPIPGSTLLYTIDTNRPIGYTQPSHIVTPTLPSNGVWRAYSLDTSIDVADMIALDMGVYRLLGDAQTACQDDATYNNLGWTLVWLNSASYETRPLVPQYEWVYDISQPTPDSTTVVWYRAAKRDGTLTDSFQSSIPLGNFTNVADAMTACQNDFATYYQPPGPPVYVPPPAPTYPPPPGPGQS